MSLKQLIDNLKYLKLFYKMTYSIKKYDSILKVPKEWDSVIQDNIYLSIKFLSFMEEIDHCKQEYYMVYNDNKLDGVFMMYERPHYNLFMFTKYNLYGKMKLMYVPLSVTRPGVECNQSLNYILDTITKMKGPKMLLNLEKKDLDHRYAIGLTCPKCIFYNHFNSFEEYLNQLRSNYRYRYTKALERSNDLKFYFLEDNRSFNNEMYNCYLQVYNKSKIRVEKLPIEFFRGEFFKIFVLERKEDNKVVGFGQLLENGDELIFEFVGVDYQYNTEYDTYHRILLEIVRYGIEYHFKTIDFGQTADESKLKLGSKYTYLYAYLHHSNKLINQINKKLAKKIEYKPIETEFNVFKKEIK